MPGIRARESAGRGPTNLRLPLPGPRSSFFIPLLVKIARLHPLFLRFRYLALPQLPDFVRASLDFHFSPPLP